MMKKLFSFNKTKTKNETKDISENETKDISEKNEVEITETKDIVDDKENEKKEKEYFETGLKGDDIDITFISKRHRNLKVMCCLMIEDVIDIENEKNIIGKLFQNEETEDYDDDRDDIKFVDDLKELEKEKECYFEYDQNGFHYKGNVFFNLMKFDFDVANVGLKLVLKKYNKIEYETDNSYKRDIVDDLIDAARKDDKHILDIGQDIAKIKKELELKKQETENTKNEETDNEDNPLNR